MIEDRDGLTRCIRSPAIPATEPFDQYKSVLREVTDANEVPLFRRHDIMGHWAERALFDLITVDRDKLPLVASRLYDCIGRAVADFMTRGAHPATSTPGASSGGHQ